MVLVVHLVLVLGMGMVVALGWAVAAAPAGAGEAFPGRGPAGFRQEGVAPVLVSLAGRCSWTMV